MPQTPINSFDYYFPNFKNNIRLQNVFQFFISLPHKQRKYEPCSSAMHSIRVAQQIAHTQQPETNTQSQIIIALCHDVLEDFPSLTPHHLKKYCTDYEIQQIQILTKSRHTKYSEYIQIVKNSQEAQAIKKLDMLDNLQTANRNQQKKYEKYLALFD